MMADLDAQLAITADATGVETGVGKAKRSLSDLGKAGAEAGAKAGKGLDGVGDGAERASAKVKRAEANWVNSIQRTIAAAEAGSRANSKYFETIAQQRGIDVSGHKALLEQLDLVNAKQQASAVTMAKGATVLNAYGLSAKQTAAAMRGVPAQLTDIITSLQGGQAPLTVLLQQGGQLRDMFGGIVPAARALGSGLMSLINPFTLSAAAAVTLYTAFEQGQKESREFSNAILLTNNAVGLTVGQMNQMAAAVGATTGNQSKAAAAIAELARQGIGGATSMEKLATAAIRMESATGQSVAETAKKFAELKKAPLEALLKLNEGTNFVTEALYKQVKALEDQGRNTDAARVAIAAYNQEMDRISTGVQNLGYLERAWKAAAAAAAGYWESVRGIGRTEGLEDRLKAAQKLLQDWESTQPGKRTTEQTAAVARFGGLDGLKNQILGLEELIGNQRAAAQIEGERTQRDQARRKFLEDEVKFLDASKKLRQDMAKDIAETNELQKRGFITETEATKRIAEIKAYYASKAPKGTERSDDRAATLLDVGRIQAAATQIVDTYTSADRVLEAKRAAGLVQESAYYAEKRKMLEDSVNIQIWALQAENTRLSQEKLNTTDRLNNLRKMEENEGKIAKLQAEAATNRAIFSIQEAAAIQARTTALERANQVAEDYHNGNLRRYQRESQGMGIGSQERERLAGRADIEDRYDAQRRDIFRQRAAAELLAGPDGLNEGAKRYYEEYLSLLDGYQKRERDAYDAQYTEITTKQKNWTLGASEALKNYFTESENLFKQTEAAVSSAFKGMEDVMVKFVMTGKLSFTDLANSIVADITRIIVKQQIMQMVMGSMGSIGGIVGRLFGTSGQAAVASALPGNSLDNLMKLTGGFGTMMTLDGGGYTGGGPRTGGLDGRGGFLAMMHPQETVIDHTKGQGVRAMPNLNVTVQMPPGATRETAMQFGAVAGQRIQRSLARNS